MKLETDVLLFIEHAARELDAASLVAHYFLTESPFSIRIESLVYDCQKALETYDPKVVLLPYCYSATDWRVHQIVRSWPSAAFVNLAHEQLFRAVQIHQKAPKDSFARKRVIHHCWGDFYAEFLKRCGVAAENLFVNGNLHYEFYAPHYRSLLQSRQALARRHGLDASRRWLLFPENYGDLFNKNTIVTEFIRLGYSLEEAERRKDFVRESFRETLHWLKSVPSEYEVIIRPRPATSLDQFTKACLHVMGEFPRHVHVIKSHAVREWIMASDVVLSSYSTTLLEAALADKPLFMLAPLTFPDFMQADWYPYANQIRTMAELQTVLTSNLPANHGALKRYVEQRMLRHPRPVRRLFLYLKSRLERARDAASGAWDAEDASALPSVSDMPDVASVIEAKHDSDRLDRSALDARIRQWSTFFATHPESSAPSISGA